MRLRRLLIEPQVLMFMNSCVFRITGADLPADAVLKYASIDPMTGLIQLFIHSADFDEVALGAIPPVHPGPEITRVG